jgi:hypothetical protein
VPGARLASPQHAPGGRPAIASKHRSPLDLQDQWRRVRRYLNEHRHDLTLLAQQLYPESWRVADSPLLAREGWIPATPIELDSLQLTWSERPLQREFDPSESATGFVLPLRSEGRRFASYAQALAELDPPRLLDDRTAYRLLDFDLRGNRPKLSFARGSYFDVINICEAVAHEFAALVGTSEFVDGPAKHRLPLRASIGDPTDLTRRPVIPAISVLTLKRPANPGATECLLHWRDPSKVASGGGLYQVTPVGMFQPSSDAPWNETNDFDLWRSIVRELSEELLGTSEDYGSERAPIDYEQWPLYTTLAAARRSSTLRIFWLGLGIDPLTLVADLLVVAVFDADLFDAVFPRLASINEEGHLVRVNDESGATTGLPFTEDSIVRFIKTEPIQAAGAGLLQLAWRHRAALLGR